MNFCPISEKRRDDFISWELDMFIVQCFWGILKAADSSLFTRHLQEVYWFRHDIG